MNLLNYFNKKLHIFCAIVSSLIFYISFSFLSPFLPFINNITSLEDNYTYSFNCNLDEYCTDQNEIDQSLRYHYEYSEEETILYANKQGAMYGLPVYSSHPFSSIFIFMMRNANNLSTNSTYNFQDLFSSNQSLKSSLGEVDLVFDKLIILDNVHDAEYIIYPHITVPSGLYLNDNNSFALSGNEIKSSIIESRNINALVSGLLAIIPLVVLLAFSYLFIDLTVKDERLTFAVNMIFYKSKRRSSFEMFIKVYWPFALYSLIFSSIFYFIFIKTSLLIFFSFTIAILLIFAIFAWIITSKQTKKAVRSLTTI